MARKAQPTVKLALVEGISEAEASNQKVAQIKSAATLLFLKDGFDGATMDTVARKAGVSKSTLYAHFADKKELFAAVVVGEMQRVNTEIWSPASDLENVEDILRDIAKKYYNLFMTERAFAFKRAILGALPRFPEIGKIIFEGGPTQIAGKITALFEDARDRNVLKMDDPAMAATQFMGLIRTDVEMMGMFSVKALPRTEIDLRIEAAIKMFMTYYGHDKNTAPGASVD